ncbi:hypothetical protein [Streptomyces griseoruber]|uniref:Secreted protein n=1 Tax=Streptomyces griseoruber TaxID=1943 RepID=A0A101T9Y5_9ACTN|nr:hypothetical protein [Streptomyces griseoruber]KUN88449.1 hypothetical protein AQJ64_02975 [Streptomyces griseoruber]
MRRTAPFLLAAALLVAAGPVAVADPAAEVGPGSADPGGSVTVSVSCDPLGGTAPETLDAASPAFSEGTVKLTKVPGGDETAAGPTYQGSAHVAPDLGEDDGGLGPDTAWTVDGTCPAPPGGQGSPWSATFDVNRPTPAGGTTAASGGAGLDGGVGAGSGAGAGAGVGGGAGGGGVPPCPPAPGQSASSCDGGRTCPHGNPCPTARPTERPTTPATVEHGVRAGTGGTFRDSVPALVAGGLLIAGAFGAAAHRLLRRRRTPADA